MEEWERVLSTNLTGYFLCVKHAVPHLRKTHGSIVNIASTRALQSEAHTEAYSASKGGVVALTHALGDQPRPGNSCELHKSWLDRSGKLEKACAVSNTRSSGV